MVSKSKNNTPYFVLDEEQYLLFAPFGSYGARYYVPDPDVRDRIEKWYTTVTALGMMPTFLKMVVGIIFRHDRSHVYIETDTFFVALLCFWVATIIIFKKQTASLVLATPRPRFFDNCVMLSRSISLTGLWAWQIGATLWAMLWFWVMFKLHIKDLEGRMLFGIFLAPSPLIILGCSFLIYLKSLRPTTTRKNPA